MNFYQFHIGDYVKDTAHLSIEEDLCFRRLLDMYYDTEAPIPLETQSVSRRLRLGSELVISVLKEFFQETENGWVNLRCEAEIKAYHHICARNRANGKLGGRPKKTQSVSTGNPLETQTKPKQNQTMNHEPINSKRAERVSNGFDSVDFLVAKGVRRDVARDWTAMRKAKKATPSETAIVGIEREASKAGLPLEAALSVCCERGWTGFKAEWVAGQQIAGAPRPRQLAI